MTEPITIKEFQKKVTDFSKQYKESCDFEDTLFYLKESLNKLKKSAYFKVSSQSFKDSVNAELKVIENKETGSTFLSKSKFFVEVLNFVWNHPEKVKLLKVETYVENFNRSENMADNVTCFVFSGELGNILESAKSLFENDGEVYFQIENNKLHKIVINENTSYDYFKKVFLKHFCDDPECFQNVFEIQENKAVLI